MSEGILKHLYKPALIMLHQIKELKTEYQKYELIESAFLAFCPDNHQPLEDLMGLVCITNAEKKVY